MSPSPSHPWFHRYAVLTATVALCLPIMVGAVVTTRGAGMAFPDWPSSDGGNMFLYNWLASTGHKFLEHGHRLAGALIGFLSIGLALFAWKVERRRWVRLLSFSVLGAVIAQGLLGGQRVLLDARGLAFLHGLFASWVFALMSVVALITSKGWMANHITDLRLLNPCRYSSACLVGAIGLQYVLGGLLRHQGMVLYEHIGFAFVVLLCGMWQFVTATNTREPWLSTTAFLLMGCLVLQLMVGGATYVVKFGFENYVAQEDSAVQVVVRTGHVLVGMLAWMLAVTQAVRVQRIWYQARAFTPAIPNAISPSVSGGAS